MEKENNKQNIDELTGESNIMGAPKYNLAIVSLQGSTGVFQKKTKQDDGEMKTEDLGKSIELTTLVWKRVLNRFISSKGIIEEIIFSSEHSAFNDKITIFSNRDGKITAIDEGEAKAMKEKHTLKMTQVIYSLMGDEIVKLQVKGSGLSNLYEFRPDIQKLGKHFHELLLDLGMVELSGPLGKYYAIEFKIKKNLTNKEKIAVEDKIREVAGKIEEIENYYKDKNEEMENFRGGGTFKPKVEVDGIPVVEEPGADKDEEPVEPAEEPEEIDVNEIPF